MTVLVQDYQPHRHKTCVRSAGDFTRRVVSQADAVSIWLPRSVFVAAWVLPVPMGLLSAGIVNTVLFASLTAIVGSSSVYLLGRWAVAPWRAKRFATCTERLEHCLAQIGEQFRFIHAWRHPYPGVLAVSDDEQLWIMERSTGYRLERVPRSTILDVQSIVPSKSALRQSYAKSAPNVRSNNGQQPIRRIALRFKLPNTSDIRTVVIDLGDDHRAADCLRHVLLNASFRVVQQRARQSKHAVAVGGAHARE